MTAAVQAAAPELPTTTWSEIEAALVENNHKWTRSESRAVWSRCSARRGELLVRAESLPIQSDADAASALLIAMWAGDHDRQDEGWTDLGHNVQRGNIILSVQRYLAGRAAS